MAGIGEGEVNVWLGESQAVFTAGRTTLTTRLIDGEFPNYQQLIPEGHANHLDIKTESFAKAVERVSLVAREYTPVKIHLGAEVQLTATEAGVADALEALEDVDYAGEPMVIAFNPRFLREGFESVESETSRLHIENPTKSAILKGADREDFLYLFMPVILPEG